MQEETLESAAELEMYRRMEAKYGDMCLARLLQKEFEQGLNDLLVDANFINAWYRNRGNNGN